MARTIAHLRQLVAGEVVAVENPLGAPRFRRADPTLVLEKQPLSAFMGPPWPFVIRPITRTDRRRTTGAIAGAMRDTEPRIEVVVGYLDQHVEDLALTMADDDDRLLRLLFASRNWDTENTGCELCWYEGAKYENDPTGLPRALLTQVWRLEVHDEWTGSPV